MNLTRRFAEALGETVNRLVREYIEQLAGKIDRKELAEEFRKLTRNAQGNSRAGSSTAKRFTSANELVILRPRGWRGVRIVNPFLSNP